MKLKDSLKKCDLIEETKLNSTGICLGLKIAQNLIK